MSRRKRYTRNLGRRIGSPLPIRTTAEWVRFEHEHEPYGVFWYLRKAYDALPSYERRELDALSDWFNEHLGLPSRVTMERFWFRVEAEEHVEQARRLAVLLRMAGVPIVERRTQRIPGKVSWEDRHQVAVRTFRDTPQPGRGESQIPCALRPAN